MPSSMTATGLPAASTRMTRPPRLASRAATSARLESWPDRGCRFHQGTHLHQRQPQAQLGVLDALGGADPHESADQDRDEEQLQVKRLVAGQRGDHEAAHDQHDQHASGPAGGDGAAVL